MVLSTRAGFAWVVIVTLVQALTVVHAHALRADDWPQWRGVNRDGVWSETGILEKFPAGGLKVRWRAPVGIGFSSPVVAGGRVYVTDSELLTKPNAREAMRAFDAMTGEPLWKQAYDATFPDTGFTAQYPQGPVATPIVADGRIYALGSVGHLYCYDALKGDVVWQKNLQKEYPAGPLSALGSPLIEGDLLILMIGAKPDASVVAFEKRTGKEVWKALDEGATASSPIVINAGGTRQLIIWGEKSVTALAPATGKIQWRHRLNTTMDAAVSTPVYHDGRLLIGGLLLQLDPDKPAAEELWPQSRAASRRILSDTSTALFRDEFVYSARSFGEFVCLDAKTGKQLWETDKVTDRKSGASVHPTANGGTVLLYNDRGELIRAQLTPEGYQEISRARVLEPATTFSGRKTAWAAPAFANRHIYARTNKELVCASLAAEP